MEKKSTKIAYFVALGVFIVLLVILGIQFKGKENPVFVGDGAFYTTGDGVFLDGIQRTVDDSEGSKYALDGSYYVSPEAGTYFELSEDGNTIVGADGTEYVKSETTSKDVNGVEYTTYEEQVYSDTPFAGTFWSLLPPIVAIVLALISKEVYSSLFLGCLVGALLYTQFAPWDTIVTLVGADYGIISVLADGGNMGIIVFLVTLGIMVDLMNKGGGSEAFGRWAKKTVHTRCGAQLLTMLLGVLIFVDDYFNCLTVGAVMRPVTESHKISRAKLAYVIDSTAAPVCMIAPVSSWAAAVSGYVQSPSINGIELFLKQIPWNYYCLLTLLMIVVISVLNIDYGSMLTHEYNAQVKDDLFTTPERPFAGADDYEAPSKGKSSVLDLLVPVIVLIAVCIISLVYSGGYFDGGMTFMEAFSAAEAGPALAIGGLIGCVFTFVYFWLRGAIGFEKSMESVPQGFIQMIAPILILTFAWTLCSFTRNAMYSADFVSNAMANVGDLRMFLPAIIFIIGAAIGFATGTSWGTIGIMAPIVVSVFNYDAEPILCTIGLAAACSGGVMGDHCSPISDTTIMASAGAHCYHLNHVFTQIPYALTVAGVSFVSFILAGLIQNVFVNLLIAVALMVGTLLVIRAIVAKKHAGIFQEMAEADKALAK
ncbi:Na+/H+ antiporter NhaC family protein [Vescimonas sanitatis]|uniref:Na+/H+ antiporter NhaC family protein n=1 Tax=Vescimonas sanitatis TaxID=3376993 RepID=UPI003B76A4A7